MAFPVAVPRCSAAEPAADTRIALAESLFVDVLDAMREADLEPIVFDRCPADLDGIAAVVLPGGGDIDPNRYGGRRVPELYDVNPAHDTVDFEFTERALKEGLPILGICRGFQILNVVHGGTLIEHLDPSPIDHYVPASLAGALITEQVSWHRVHIDEHSRLAREVDVTDPLVASGHHQGLARLGPGLIVSAHAADGLIEAFENPAGTVFGVQWHPELMPAGTTRSAPFRALTGAVARTDRPRLRAGRQT